MKAERPVRTRMDRKDWELKPDSGQEPTAGVQVVAEFDDEGAARHARDEALAHELPSARGLAAVSVQAVALVDIAALLLHGAMPPWATSTKKRE